MARTKKNTTNIKEIKATNIEQKINEILDENTGNEELLIKLLAEKIKNKRNTKLLNSIWKEHVWIEKIVNGTKEFWENNKIIDDKIVEKINSRNILKTNKDTEWLVIFSDFHLFEKVSSNELNNINKFNINIAQHRLNIITNKIVKKLLDKKVDKVNIILDWDMLSWNIHKELRENNELDVVYWLNYGAKMISESILKIRSVCNKINVTCIYWNHGRMSEEYTFKKWYENFDTLLYINIWKILKSSGINNIDISIPTSFFSVINILDRKILVTHGDKLIKGSWNKALQNKINGLNNILNQLTGIDNPSDNLSFSDVIIWHRHNFNVFNIGTWKLIMNWSLKGADEYSLGAFGWVWNISQTLGFITKNEWITEIREIVVNKSEDKTDFEENDNMYKEVQDLSELI